MASTTNYKQRTVCSLQKDRQTGPISERLELRNNKATRELEKKRKGKKEREH